MWSDGRCYRVRTPPEECQDWFLLDAQNGEQTVIVGDGKKVENLLYLVCVSEMEKR